MDDVELLPMDAHIPHNSALHGSVATRGAGSSHAVDDTPFNPDPPSRRRSEFVHDPSPLHHNFTVEDVEAGTWIEADVTFYEATPQFL